MNCRASAGIIVAWTLEQEPGDVFNAGGLLSAGEHFSNSGTDGPGAYSFARSVALCGAGRMGQVDGTLIASPKCALCVKRLPNSVLSKASLNAGATLWQSNGWRRNPNAPGSFTPMVMCGFIMENSPICLGVILPENGSVCDVPNQPTEKQLEADPLLSRFTIVFDREGYSPRFFAQMKEERIAILTYHKFPGELWPEQEFRTHKVSLVNGEQVSLELAERGVRVSNDLWVREVRHLSEKGHQSSILSTDYHSDLTRVAVAMFARWCQEIFFKYMRQHYNLDRLIEYQTETIPDTNRVINPAWRQLDSQIRRQNGLLNRELLQFAQIQLPQEMEPQQVEAYQRKQGQLQQAIEERRPQIEQLKAQRKTLPKHIEIKDLPEQDRFHRLRSEKKHFIDTIKLIAYRAETALAQLAREKLKRLDDARSLIRQLFRTEVDLVVQSQPISGNGGHDNYGRGENGAA